MQCPIRTERLLLRVPRIADVDPIHAWRNDPAVARYETWALPLPRERVATIIERSIESGEPVDDVYWNITVADPDDTAVMGEVGVKLAWQGRSAEIGYTFAPEHWGKGYATEATTALVAALFSRPEMTRVSAQLHPDNLASARLLERIGFRFEGHTRQSFWVGDDNSDDWFYGLTRADWQAWLNRPTEHPTTLRLVEIDEANQHAARRLDVHHTQQRLVSPVVASFADALFPEVIDGAPVVPWMRAVEADGELAAFVMLADVTDAHPETYLWRLLVDRRHQGRGIGRWILDRVVERARSQSSPGLGVSYVEGPGSPQPFYAAYGFEPTGRIIDGEIEARLDLSS